MTPTNRIEELEAALDREEKYLIDTVHDEDVGGVMQGDVEGAFHRIRSVLSAPAPLPSEEVIALASAYLAPLVVAEGAALEWPDDYSEKTQKCVREIASGFLALLLAQGGGALAAAKSLIERYHKFADDPRNYHETARGYAADSGDDHWKISKWYAGSQLKNEALDFLAAQPSAPADRDARKRAISDPLFQEEIELGAHRFLKDRGWLAQSNFSYHSVKGLMQAYALQVLEHRPATCAYPECGCDADAICDVTKAGRGIKSPSPSAGERESGAGERLIVRRRMER